MASKTTFLEIDKLSNSRGLITLTDFGGGLNTAFSNEVLNDNEAIIRKNWGTDEVGALQKVNGSTKLNSAAIASKAVKGLFRVYQSDGTTKLLAVVDTKLWYSDDAGATFTQATNGTGLDADDFNSGVNFNNLFFFTNKTDNLQHYTPGTDTMAAATDQPTDPCGVLFKRSDNRMVAVNNDVNGSTLYFSKLNPTGAAADDWSAANDAGSIAIDGAKSERLISGTSFGAYDLIFKDYSTFKVWGYPTPQTYRLPGSPGCRAPYSVAGNATEGVSFHLASDGIYMWDGNRFYRISQVIQPLIDNINPSFVQNAFGIYRNGLYWFFYTKSGDTTNQNCIIYDALRSNPYEGKTIWYERPGLSINTPVVLGGVGDSNQLFGGDSGATGFIRRLDFSSSGDDSGSNIEAIWQSRYMDSDRAYLTKRYTKIRVDYFLAKGNLLVNWYTNKGTTSGNFQIPQSQTGVALDTFVLDTDSLVDDIESTHTERLPDTAIGKDISVKITHDSDGTAPIIRKVVIEIEALYEE